VWHLSFEDGLQGAEIGMNAADLVGCYSLSNPIEVVRELCCVIEDICSGLDISSLAGSHNAQHDFNAANLTIGAAGITLNRLLNGTAVFDENIINDSQTTGDIAIRLGVRHAVGAANNLTATYELTQSVCDLDLRIWDVDQSDAIVVQAFSNGNPVSYTTTLGSCVAQSGNMFTPNGSSCQVQVSGNMSHSFMIAFDDCIDQFDIIIYDQGAGTGGSYSLVVGDGCTAGEEAQGGTLTGGPYDFCVSDGVPDFILTDEDALTGNAGQFSSWIITDDELNILGLPNDPTTVDFDVAGVGTCLLWNISYNNFIEGLAVGQNAANLIGCFSLSNSLAIERNICCPEPVCSTPDVASLHGSHSAEADFNNANLMIGNSGISLTRTLTGTATFDENQINNSQTTGDIGIRLGTRNAVGSANSMIATYDMSAAVCALDIAIWDIDRTDELVISASLNGTNVSYTTSLGACVAQTGNTFKPDGPTCEVQAHPRRDHRAIITFDGCIDQLVIQIYDQGGDDGGSYTLVIGEGCEDISDPDGGVLTGGPFEFCVDDGEADFIASDALTLSGAVGTNSAYVITDSDLNILGIPGAPEDVDFEGAGVGVCLIWHLSFEDGLVGAEIGLNAADLNGCFDLSNPIQVIRENCCEENLLIEGSISSNGYEVSQTINSTGIVENGMVDFSAGEFINLEEGFEVVTGNVFHAFIEGCAN